MSRRCEHREGRPPRHGSWDSREPCGDSAPFLFPGNESADATPLCGHHAHELVDMGFEVWGPTGHGVCIDDADELVEVSR